MRLRFEQLDQRRLLTGDVNGDGSHDIADLHLIEADDIEDWLTEAADVNGFHEPYLRGDANLDGKVDSTCLLYTSPSPRDATLSRMPSSA